MGEREYEFGLDSFMGVTAGRNGGPIAGDQVVRDTVEEGVLAERVGIDSFNIGEHYRDDMMDSAGHVVLAAIAGRTERIRLGRAVTVLSTQDPVRLYNNFATLDAVSGGRAQLIVGRGSAIEASAVRLRPPRLRRDLRGKARVVRGAARGRADDVAGKYRPPLTDVDAHSAARGRPLAGLGGLGRQPRVGDPRRTVRAAADVRGDRRQAGALQAAWSTSTAERWREYGHPIDLPAGLHTLGYVAATDDEAIEITVASTGSRRSTRAARERGWRQPTRAQFDAEVAHGCVVRRLARDGRAPTRGGDASALDVDRIGLHYAVGQVPAGQRRGSIAAAGREVFPRVRELLKAYLANPMSWPALRHPREVASPVRSTHSPAPIAR